MLAYKCETVFHDLNKTYMYEFANVAIDTVNTFSMVHLLLDLSYFLLRYRRRCVCEYRVA